MALNANKTGQKIANLIKTVQIRSEADVPILWAQIIGAIYDDIKSDIQVLLPADTVVVDVVYEKVKQTDGTTVEKVVGKKNENPLQSGVS